MNDTASTQLVDLVASRPAAQIVANLFTFVLTNGTTYNWTDWRKPITVGSTVYAPLKIKRGQVKLSRGMSIDSSDVQIIAGDTELLNSIRSGFFNLAIYTSQRVFAADRTLQWTPPVTRFVGRVNDIKNIGRVSATLTCKSMVVLLDNDFPRQVTQVDCYYVLFDQGCTLSQAAYVKTGTVAAGTTMNTIRSGLTDADNYYDQGVLSFTSGQMNGLAYMVKTYLSGVVYPAYPLLVTPAVGDSFTITPGCDKTMATCQSKFNNLSNFPSTPFIPDPTVTY